MLSVTVKTLDSQNHAFTCDENITVRGFKEFIAETVSVSSNSQRLIYCGRVLQDDKKLSDYDVNGKVIHMVQRAPPQSESRNNASENQRHNNWTPRMQYRGQLHRNTMYVGAVSVPTLVEAGLPTPQLSNTLSNSRLVVAKRMLNKAMQLMDRMDDPSLPLHVNSSENNRNRTTQTPTQNENEGLDSNAGRNQNAENVSQPNSDLPDASFSAAALINIRLSNDSNENSRVISNPINIADLSQSNLLRTSESNNSSEPANVTENQTDRRPVLHMPRPPQMAQLLEKLSETQNRLQPYIDKYRTLMTEDPSLSSGDGTDSIEFNQRIIDGVSESLHYLSHACHALSDIIVDMGQQPPRNLMCRPIIIQHSAILQTGIPIQVESHINLQSRIPTSSSTSNDDGNQSMRTTSPLAGQSEPNIRSANANMQSNQSLNSQQTLLGTLLNLPSNVELSMEISPQSAMELISHESDDGIDNQTIRSNNTSNNGSSADDTLPVAPPLVLIRDAIQSAYERHSQMHSSNSTGEMQLNAPYVTIIQQNSDSISNNLGQSTQARSNIGTHPTTATQTRSTARPHVLPPHSHSVGMGQNLDFDPFLPCNSHHIRRASITSQNSNVQSSLANQNITAESQTAAELSSNSSIRNSPAVSNNFSSTENSSTLIQNPDNLQAFSNGIGIAMALSELLQEPNNSSVHISFVGNRPEINFLPASNASATLTELYRTALAHFEELEGQSFVVDLMLCLLRNISPPGLIQLSLGETRYLENLRQPLCEFMEHSFPDVSANLIAEIAVENVMSSGHSLFQTLETREEEVNYANVDFPKTVECLLRKVLVSFIYLLFDKGVQNSAFAEQTLLLVKKLEEQFFSLIQHLFKNGIDCIENIVSRFVNQLIVSMPPIFQQSISNVISPRIQLFLSKAASINKPDVEKIFVFKDSNCFQLPGTSSDLSSNVKILRKEYYHSQEMETQDDFYDLDLKDDEVIKTFAGHEHFPSEWVPIISRDVSKQRRQFQNKSTYQVPFSDGYLGGMPSKRRKVIENQKLPLLMGSSTSNTITTSVENLVREGIIHSGNDDIIGAATAVSSSPAVRNAFGNAIKDVLNATKLSIFDFSNSKRFPNAIKCFSNNNNNNKSLKK